MMIRVLKLMKWLLLVLLVLCCILASVPFWLVAVWVGAGEAYGQLHDAVRDNLYERMWVDINGPRVVK
tara:strand:- start:9629 stop:9832 length:204 start_codon:yes stop_codon:yes gene_type:complete